MSTTRPVRIARPVIGPKGGEARRTQFAGGWVPNRAGEERARRIFVLFAVVLVAIYAAFVGLASLGSGSGLRSAPAAWGIFTLLAVLLGLWGWNLTFGKTPRGAQRRDADILVRERLGRVQRFPIENTGALRVVQQYGGGILGPRPTEVVELLTKERRRRQYLVGERFFQELAGL